MAIGETMSNYSDWRQLYQNNFTATQVQTPPTNTATAAGTYSSATSTSRNNTLIPDQGRISKPIRRRSRASRQTPTTLLNTDITNFRAMVQHFTGGPATSPQLHGGGGGTPAGGFYVQYPNQLQQQQHVFLSSVNSRQDGSGGGLAQSNQAAAAGSSSMNEDGDHDSYML
ncbi:VQ motif-containing protein 22 [Primulina eburnea]|uniref:VQ motif-containing protein 22 n=1 Tax=Primulina eburnea TaxID=1245227 RepID=UPI003C6C240E